MAVFLKSMQHYFGENKNSSDSTRGDLRFKEGSVKIVRNGAD